MGFVFFGGGGGCNIRNSAQVEITWSPVTVGAKLHFDFAVLISSLYK